MRKHTITLLLLLLLSACSARPDDGSIRGRILLWHSGGTAEGVVLDEFIRRFEEIYPDTSVLRVLVPEAELISRYRNATLSGLGPDLFIASTRSIYDLASSDLIQPIDAYSPDMSLYLSGAVTNVMVEQQTYGIPYSLSPVALYYNPALVDVPAATLSDLLTDAANGRGVGINTRFDSAFWGVQSFGGTLFDDGGRVLLNQGAFASWLNWLKNAQASPGISISPDNATLRRLFIDGQIAYYVGRPEDLPVIKETLSSVAVVPLPSGQSGNSGPLLQSKAFLFNPNSPGTAPRTAVTLAQFITNRTQSTTLARDLLIVPANSSVRIDSRAFPAVTGFLAQSRTAVAMPNTEQMELLLQMGDQTYTRVLDGVVDPNDAANDLTVAVNETIGLETIVAADFRRCTLSGDLVLWHSWSDDNADTLADIVAAYMQNCPGVTVELTAYDDPQEMTSDYITVSQNINLPDVLLTSSANTYALASGGYVAPLKSEDLQQFIPTTLDTVRFAGNIYGLPITLSTSALISNREQVSDTPNLLDNLLTEASTGNGVVIPVGFEEAYWGTNAFGVTLFDGEYRVILDQTGFANWLEWLRQAQAAPGITLTTDINDAINAFINRTAAYIIAPPEALPPLIAELEESALQVTNLPPGPIGNAAPLISIQALYINAGIDDEQMELAIDFIRFASGDESQQRILDQTDFVPTAVNLDMTGSRLKAAFRRQAEIAVTLPHVSQRSALIARGDALYTDLLQLTNTSTAELVQTFVEQVNAENGFESVPTLTPTPLAEMTPAPVATADGSQEDTPANE